MADIRPCLLRKNFSILDPVRADGDLLVLILDLLKMIEGLKLASRILYRVQGITASLGDASAAAYVFFMARWVSFVVRRPRLLIYL